MTKSVILLLLTLMLLPMCGCMQSAPEATLPPGITKPEGSVISMNPPVVEGRVTKLTDDHIFLSVQGVEWKLELDDKAEWEIKRYKELDMPVLVGSFVMIYYEEDEDGEREATRIEHVEMN